MPHSNHDLKRAELNTDGLRNDDVCTAGRTRCNPPYLCGSTSEQSLYEKMNSKGEKHGDKAA